MGQSIFWFLLYIIILLLEPALFSQEVRRVSQNYLSRNQNLLSCNYNKILRARLTFVSQANNHTLLGRARSGFGFLIKPGKKALTHSKRWNASPENIQKRFLKKKTIISNQELIRAFNVAEYNPLIGDLKKLEIAVKKLQNVEGALEINGPLRNVLMFGKKGSDVGHLNTARGSMYELEKALELIEQNEFPLELEKHLTFESTSREFDIITSKRLIECKNVDWSKIMSGKLANMKGQFGSQIKIAKGRGKIFEVHSKRPIPDVLKQWFGKKGILFIEG